jgi:cytochrome c-type biogenesis protein CcmH/NrfG
MEPRDQHIYQEAAELWQALFDEPPPRTDGATLLEIITSRLPTADYQRLRSPHLRPATISGPSQAAANRETLR